MLYQPVVRSVTLLRIGFSNNNRSFVALHKIKRVFEIQADIEAIASDVSLYEASNFIKRVETIDFIEFHIINRLESRLQEACAPAQLLVLKRHAEKLIAELEAVNNNLFDKLRAAICTGQYTGSAFKRLLGEYMPVDPDDEHIYEPGYDHLDILINGLFPFPFIPEPTKTLAPEMVFYQKTPARVIFDLIPQVQFTQQDVFFDLGSGLGQVAILVNLLAGIVAKGVEFEPAFCQYAQDCAAALNLPALTFINTDARQADYSEGTVFFMYTPFKGTLLQDVLALLRKEALVRKIKLITYGPCTSEVALQSWLRSAIPQHNHVYQPGIFCSF